MPAFVPPLPNAPWLLAACMGHLIGDYILQDDHQAAGKKVSSWICAWHCLLWTCSVYALAGGPVWFLPILFVSHFLQDRWGFVKWWMLSRGQEKFASPPMAPWSMIVVDNVLHLIVLYALSLYA